MSKQYSVISKQCSVFSKQCSVFSKQCSVSSKQWTVNSERCLVQEGQGERWMAQDGMDTLDGYRRISINFLPEGKR